MNRKTDFLGIVLFLFILICCFALGWVSCIIMESSREQISTGDRLNYSDFIYNSSRFCFDYETITVHEVIGTNSMDPVLDENTHTIQFKPKTIKDIQIGDIVSYHNDEIGLIVHRVVDMKNDSIKARGDNLLMDDVGWIPFEKVEGVVIGIIY